MCCKVCTNPCVSIVFQCVCACVYASNYLKKGKNMASRLEEAAGLLTFLFLCQYSLALHTVINISGEDASGVLLAGTNQALNCSVIGPTSYHLFATFRWLRNDSSLLTTTMNNLRYVFSILEFNPLHTSDSGQYQCVVGMWIETEDNSIIIISGKITDEIELNVTSEYHCML